MTKHKQLVRLIGVVACIWPLAAIAQSEDEGFALGEIEEKTEPKPIYTSEVEVGAGYVSEDSFKFGEYTGHDDQGVFGIGSVTIRGRDPYDGETTQYYEAIGSNLGLESRALDLVYGRQGKYRISLDYNQIPHFVTDRARSPYNGVGSSNLTLPGGWVGAPSTAAMAALNANLRQIDIQTERKRFGGNILWNLSRNWKLNASYHRDLKDGLDTIGGAFATNGGNPSAIILPETIDYTTDKVDVAVQFAGKRTQFELGYHLSLFSNDTSSLTFQNPFSGRFSGGAWNAATGFPTGFGQMALPPDNQAHNVTFAGGHTFGETTRLNLNLSWSRMLQDQTFLAFSAIPALNASVTTPLPRSSLDGEIDNLVVGVRGTTRPMRALQLGANYRYENLDNNTPRDIYVRIRADAQTQPAGIANANARINLPYSFEKHSAGLNGSYRLTPWAKVALGYDFVQAERDFQEKSKTRDHAFNGKLKLTPTDYASGSLQYTHSIRKGNEYIGNFPFLSSHTAACVPVPCGTFEQRSDLRKFHIADRDGDIARATLALMPHHTLTVVLDGSFTNYDYDNSVLGLQDSRTVAGTLDASFSPVKQLSTHGFVTYENIRREQNGHSFTNAGNLFTPARDWTVTSRDEIWTAGVGGDWAVIEDSVDFSLDYTFTMATTRFDI